MRNETVRSALDVSKMIKLVINVTKDNFTLPTDTTSFFFFFFYITVCFMFMYIRSVLPRLIR